MTVEFEVGESFDSFFGANVADMVRLSRLICGSASVAEEVVQDAFAVAYSRWDRIDDPRAYVRSAVLNRSRSRVRRDQVARRGLGRLSAIRDAAAPPDPDPSMTVALGRLSARQRTAVVLRYWADWSEADIANALGCRPGTVKSLLSRALDQLREVIIP